jgi:hypothetical protein
MNQPSLLDQKPAAYSIPVPDETIDVVSEPATTAIAVREDNEDAMTAFAHVGVGIETAKEIAFRLNDIVEKQGLFTVISKKKHLWVEAWCTCAGMCGLSPRTAWCKRIMNPENGLVLGYEARVEVVRLSTDQVVGAAETECWMDEKLAGRLRWTEKHAAKSMAQTRGTSKAIAQILRWIPILAGYSGTPAEEADGDNGQPEVRPSPVADPNAATAQPRGERVTVEQIANLLERWKKCENPSQQSFADWQLYVHTTSDRTFDIKKAGQWSKADYDAVDLALQGRGA